MSEQKELREALAAQAPKPSTEQEAFRAKYGGVCPCCQNKNVTNSDKGEGVPCPYCVTGELSWKLAAAPASLSTGRLEGLVKTWRE
jgi:hypothetical protein